jgi:hypothetical protein
LRDLQEPTSWLLIDAALEHSSLIPRESFVDGHCASVPRMPRIKDFSRFDIMGVALSSCTTGSATIRAKTIGFCFLRGQRQWRTWEQYGVENDWEVC